MNFTFRQLEDMKQLSQLIDFLASQSLGYPKYDEWVQRTEGELSIGYKGAILAYSDGKLVGDIVYQPHKQMPSFLEIKNLRVHNDLRMRYFGRFIVKQLESEFKENYDALIVDVRADQTNTLKFFAVEGYSPVLSIPLYDPNVEDTTFVKFFREQQNKEEIISSARNFLVSHSL